MPTTRKQKKTRKSRGLEVLSDIENLDIMLGGDRYNGTVRERSLDSNSVRRRESIVSNNLDNEGGSLFSNCRNDEPRTSADLGQNSAEANSLAEINRLSSELNSRISREMDEMMSNVDTLIQRAINEAISSQVLPQIQNVIMAGSGRETRRGWEVPVERPETNAEEQRIPSAKADCRNEQHDGYRPSGQSSRHAHDSNKTQFVLLDIQTSKQHPDVCTSKHLERHVMASHATLSSQVLKLKQLNFFKSTGHCWWYLIGAGGNSGWQCKQYTYTSFF